MSNVTIARTSVWAPCSFGNAPKLTRVLELNDGFYSGSSAYAILKIEFDGRFLEPFNGYFYGSCRTDSGSLGDAVHTLDHGQVVCRKWDSYTSVTTYPSAYSFDDDWHHYVIISNLSGDNNDKIYIDGGLARSYNTSNYMTQPAEKTFTLRIFGSAFALGSVPKVQLKNMAWYDLSLNLRDSWNWEAGDADITGWANGVFKFVA